MSNSRKLARLLAIAAGLTLGMAAQAQTRHDDKPHGPPKKAVVKSDIKQPMGGPRHDEKPHGPPAKLEKKADSNKK